MLAALLLLCSFTDASLCFHSTQEKQGRNKQFGVKKDKWMMFPLWSHDKEQFLFQESSCTSVLRWYLCVWKVTLPSHPWVSQFCTHVCDHKDGSLCTPCFIYRRIFIMMGLQWWLKEDVMLQSFTISQLKTTVKAATSLSWHLKSVWITHTMSDRQIVCASQISSFFLLL